MQNNLTFPTNIQLGGGFWPLHNDSLIEEPVDPGTTVTYSWLITESNGPAASDVSTVAYAYRSNADYTADMNAGLFGAVVVAKKVRLLPDHKKFVAPTSAREMQASYCLAEE